LAPAKAAPAVSSVLSSKDREALAQRVVRCIGVVAVKLSALADDIRALWAQFAVLPKGETIHGCATKAEFCKKVLHKTPRAVRYLLNGDSNQHYVPVAQRGNISPVPVALKHWAHETFLIKDEADELLTIVETLPWQANDDLWQPNKNDGSDAAAIHFGKSYQMGGGAKDGEVPVIDSRLLPIIARVEQRTGVKVNYVQCHRYGPTAFVQPHYDPSALCVPMLTMGQARTFRVGGGYLHKSSGKVNGLLECQQWQRPIENHIPEAEIVMGHGDLLVFTGGNVLHSMFPADQDPNFNAGGFAYRYSFIFRYTTDAMRERGPSKRALKGTDHLAQLAAARISLPTPAVEPVTDNIAQAVPSTNRNVFRQPEEESTRIALEMINAGFKELSNTHTYPKSKLCFARRLAKYSLNYMMNDIAPDND
jgi:hypothetical protein